jgi:NitT/TauT family transport system substrate-binding protein
MMGEINKLVEGSEQGIGFLEPADYQRTVDVLLASGSDPVITRAPEGAWSHEVWEAM